LIDVKGVFSVELDTSFDIPFLSFPKTTRVGLVENSISLITKLDLDYWEVDPDWDEKIFKSAAQAKRPVRSGDISHELKIKAGSNVCIRLVTIQGRLYQLNIQAISNTANGF
jgi:hypothetical protein